MPEYYEIVVQGYLDPQWSAWFGGLAVSHGEKSQTVLAGPIADQAALYGVLNRLRDLGLTLVSVKRAETDSGEGSKHNR